MGNFGVVLCIWYRNHTVSKLVTNHSCHNFSSTKSTSVGRVEISVKTDPAVGPFFLGHLLWYGVWIQVAHARLAWLFLGPGLQVNETVENAVQMWRYFETHH